VDSKFISTPRHPEQNRGIPLRKLEGLITGSLDCRSG
jgi:hypothetical protein